MIEDGNSTMEVLISSLWMLTRTIILNYHKRLIELVKVGGIDWVRQHSMIWICGGTT
ncbi:hypothetical protein NC652_023617 [Populus alba x Populus x berolinensis]|nr:hypothetical protein NC652_023617 [Populus alba x Populus x berolinensis]